MSHSQDRTIWLENTEMSQLKGSCKQHILRVQLGELVVVSMSFHCGKKNRTHKRQSEAVLTTAQQESWSNTSPIFLC